MDTMQSQTDDYIQFQNFSITFLILKEVSLTYPVTLYSKFKHISQSDIPLCDIIYTITDVYTTLSGPGNQEEIHFWE